ncbi:MAG: HdeD family acid-resistance protein [Dongiaceae bacterium]
MGICAIVGGAFEIIHAFWTKGWGGFLWQILLGLLYIAGGIVLVSQPVSGSLVLTYVIGLVLLASGIVRVFLGIRHWQDSGWLLFLSGIFRILAGLAGVGTMGHRVRAWRRPDLSRHGVAGFCMAARGRDSPRLSR